MTTFQKQLIVNRFNIPKEILDIIKCYAFHTINRLNTEDERYPLLRSIPTKRYDPDDSTMYVYMRITQDKDYFMIYCDFEIQLQTLFYENDHHIQVIDAHRYSIETTKLI